MDRQILQRKREEYRARVIRLDQHLIRKFGLIKNKVYLKIEDYLINCVPYDISLETCRVVSVLDPREIEFFSQYIGKTHALHITMAHHSFGRPISMFFKVRIEDIKQYNPESSVCLIHLSVLTVPNDFAEIFVETVEAMDGLLSLYRQSGPASPPASMDLYRRMGNARYVDVEIEEDPLSHQLKLTALRPGRVTLFGDLDGRDPSADQTVEIELPQAEDVIYLKGKIAEVRRSAEVDEFGFLDVDLEFSPAFVETISAYIPQKKAEE